ncbi:MAG: hypothetical protein AB2708_14205 [Candidatus Thiodiazotropha taylori]
MIFHRGAYKHIIFTTNGAESLKTAEDHVPPNRKACIAQLRRLLKQLGDRGSLRSPDQCRNEGNDIYAIKANCGLRAYGWFDHDENTDTSLFVVGLCVLKKKQKMDQSDRNQVIREREQFRED